MGPAIKRREDLAFEFELDGQYRPWLLAVDVAPGLGVVADVMDARILEDRGIEIRASSACVSNHRHGEIFCVPSAMRASASGSAILSYF